MTTQPTTVIAVDFGTTNSYFCKCPSRQLSPVGVDFGGGRDGIPTAILYRQSRPALIGNWALHEYGEATAEEKQSYQLVAQFKPDLAVSEQARTHAVDFLRAIVTKARNQHIALAPAESQVIFGVPSEADEAYKQTLQQVALQAGYGDVRVVDEPKGALLYHLWHKDFSPSEAREGVLVIDFGGGTCDFAFMRDLEVRHSWGDMALGGRLFDDLFYQWFAEQNPDCLAEIERASDFYYVYAYLCREAKEFFSLTMARDRRESVNKSIGRYGSLRGMTWTGFVERARHYHPSGALLKHLEDLGVSAAGLGVSDGERDLLDWFKRSLEEGLQSQTGRDSGIGRVILAGGSSQWPFVADIVTECLGVDPGKLMRSDRPYAAISEGLAILPALQETFGTLRANLRRDVPRFCEEQIKPMLRQVTDTYAAEIAADVTYELFDQRIRPQLEAFRVEGGSVSDLKQRTSAEVEAFETQLRAIVEKRSQHLRTGLPERVRALFAQWLMSFGLSVPEDALSGECDVLVRDGLLDEHLPDLYGGIVEAVGWFVIAGVASFGAAIGGGAGTALILSGPLGWLVGGVLTGVIALLGVRYGKDRAKALAETWVAPTWLTKRVLSEAKIAKSRDQFQQDIRGRLQKQCMALHAEFQSRIAQVAEQQIEALSEITQL